MEALYIFLIIITVSLAATILFIIIKRLHLFSENSSSSGIITNKPNSLRSRSNYNMKVKFDDLPSLTAEEESRLVEVKDRKLLARIDNAIPGTLQAVANTGSAKAFHDMAKSAGKLYRAVIPNNAVLFQSKEMAGAVRGGYHLLGTNTIGQANWKPVDMKAANNLAAVGSVNAAMSVGSMVVGQYYMTQINDQLEGITSGIEKIADFQQNEFKSKVYALVAEVQKTSTFQIEILESDELRNRELQHLKSLEHECAQLLGQANLSLQEIADKQDIEYDEYEKLICEAELWYQYQQIILEVMYKISDLTHALNLGAISKENSYALCLPYAKQSVGTLTKLNEWHNSNIDKFKIDISESRRKRQGIGGFFMKGLGLFNDDFNYKKIEDGTMSRIEHQIDGADITKPIEGTDLYTEDVQLIAKDGKLYYLPQESDSAENDNKDRAE